MAQTNQKSLFETEETGEEAEDEIELQNASREIRSLGLIVEFVDGYAKGWKFPIPEAYKNELDIKLQPRMEPVLDENGKQMMVEVKDKDGNVKLKMDSTPKLKKKTKAVMRWTQGNYYCFAEGHVMYDSPKAYEGEWKDALNHFKQRIQVVRATPNNLESNGQFQDGRVTFTISETSSPDEIAEGDIMLRNIGQYDLSQSDFVDFLKTGLIKEEFIKEDEFKA